jgi:hypothetical protein
LDLVAKTVNIIQMVVLPDQFAFKRVHHAHSYDVAFSGHVSG